MSSSKKILVVDDDKNIAQLLKKVLEGQYHVECCFSLGEALDLYDSISFDLVITDLNLGTDSGMSLARYVRDRDPYVEVIIVTGHASVESAREAIDLGVVSYLTKPVDIAELRTLVKRSVLSHSFNSRANEYSSLSGDVPESVKMHMVDILALYNFVSKLNQTVDLEGTLHVLLKEISTLFKSEIAVLGVSCLGFDELYAHSTNEDYCCEESVRALVAEYWNGDFEGVGLTSSSIVQGLTPLSFVGGACSKSVDKKIKMGRPFVIPLVSYGENFGFIALYKEAEIHLEQDRKEFYYAMAPLIAPPVYRGFIEKKTKAQAQTDGLTGIANRRALQEALNRDIQRAVRYSRALSVIMMDIDDFKQVNDTYGHLIGDEVLRDLTACVRSVIRGSDFFGRYGGEEFVVVLPDTAHDGATHLAERIREVVENKVSVSGDISVDYTVSVGVAVFNPEICDDCNWSELEESLIKRVDDALYKAKGNGKNCVVVAP